MTDHDIGAMNKGTKRAQEVLDENFAPLVTDGNYRRRRSVEREWDECDLSADIDSHLRLDQLFYK